MRVIDVGAGEGGGQSRCVVSVRSTVAEAGGIEIR